MGNKLLQNRVLVYIITFLRSHNTHKWVVKLVVVKHWESKANASQKSVLYLISKLLVFQIKPELFNNTVWLSTRYCIVNLLIEQVDLLDLESTFNRFSWISLFTSRDLIMEQFSTVKHPTLVDIYNILGLIHFNIFTLSFWIIKRTFFCCSISSMQRKNYST